VSSDVHTVRTGVVGFSPAETALSAVQAKKARVSLRAARAPGGAAFLSTTASASYLETADGEEKDGWGLNEEQLSVAEVEAAYVRLVAGPGSGKTRILTYRIAHMINYLNVPPRSIMCVTFTKRAAQELCERLNTLLDVNVSSQLMVGTFHSVCAKILRRSTQISDYNLNRDYIIYDGNDSEQVVKRILQEALDSFYAMNASIGRECLNGDADCKNISAQNLNENVMQRSQSAIWEDLVRCKFLTENSPVRSQLLQFLECYIKMKPEQKKRRSVTSDAVQDLLRIIGTARLHNVQAFITKKNRRTLHPTSDSLNVFAFKMAEIYELELRRCNAADFDDLLYLAVQLLHKNPHILK
jgi:superfamily I DNA/RNA helicase